MSGINPTPIQNLIEKNLLRGEVHQGKFEPSSQGFKSQ